MLILAYIVLRIMRFYKTRKSVTYQVESLLSDQHSGNKYLVIDKSRIPLSAQGNEYSISFWLFVKDYNYRYGSNKTILYRGDKENTESNPYIFLNSMSNDMTIKVQLQSNTVKDSGNAVVETFTSSPLPLKYFNPKSNISGNEISENFYNDPPATPSSGTPLPTSSTGTENTQAPVGDINSRLDKVEIQMQKLIGMQSDNTSAPGSSESSGSSSNDNSLGDKTNKIPIMYDECVIKNIPIQKWTHVVVSVFNNSLEVYIDGSLMKTCSLRGFPKPNLENMHVCANGGFDGFISNIKYSNMTLPSKDIQKMYMLGPEVNTGFFESIGIFFKRLFSVFSE